MYYFAYGSNMNPVRMRDRGIKFTQRLPATLHNARLNFDKRAAMPGEGYASIVSDIDSDVEGALYRFNEKYIKILDRFEAYPYHYEKWIVEVETQGKKIKAITYIANPEQTDNNLLPSRDYLKHLLAGKDLLSDEYYSKLKRQKCISIKNNFTNLRLFK